MVAWIDFFFQINFHCFLRSIWTAHWRSLAFEFAIGLFFKPNPLTRSRCSPFVSRDGAVGQLIWIWIYILSVIFDFLHAPVGGQKVIGNVTEVKWVRKSVNEYSWNGSWRNHRQMQMTDNLGQGNPRVNICVSDSEHGFRTLQIESTHAADWR